MDCPRDLLCAKKDEAMGFDFTYIAPGAQEERKCIRCVYDADGTYRCLPQPICEPKKEKETQQVGSELH